MRLEYKWNKVPVPRYNFKKYLSRHIAILVISGTAYTRWGKGRFRVVSTQNTEFILVLFINYIIFYINNCKPVFAPAYILVLML